MSTDTTSASPEDDEGRTQETPDTSNAAGDANGEEERTAQQAVAGENGEQGEPAQTPETSSRDDLWNVIYNLIAVVIVFGVFGIFVYFGYRLLGPASAELDIVAGMQQPEPNAKTQQVVGRVLYKMTPVADVTVFAEVTLKQRSEPPKVEQSNIQTLPAQQTNKDGEFTISGIPAGDTELSTVRVFATKPGGWFTRNKSGETVVVWPVGGGERQFSTAAGWLTYFAVFWFVASLVAALAFFPPHARALRIKYGIAVVGALGFPVIVILAFTLGQSPLNQAGGSEKVFLTAFGNFFQGTFVEEQQNEWLFSLTLPPPAEHTNAASPSDVPSKPTLVEGFGAPMWVLFLSVIGASLFTIAVIVKEIADPPNIDERNVDIRGLRKRIQLFVQHEFYIVFAPVGGIFVYQLLVLSGTANQPVIVGLIALGAGVTSNAILTKAVVLSSRLVEEAAAGRKASTPATEAGEETEVREDAEAPDPADTPTEDPQAEAATSTEPTSETEATTKKEGNAAAS